MDDWKKEHAKNVEELFQGIDAGDFNQVGKIPDRYTWLHLYSLLRLADELDNGGELYRQIYDIAIAHGHSCVRQKVHNGEKIRIVFLAISAAEWPAGDVYRLLAADDRIECCIVVAPLMDRDVESRRDSYLQTRDYFLKNGYTVREIYDAANDVCLEWSEIGGAPDILIHLTAWFSSLAQPCWAVSFPLRCVQLYIPYGIYVADSMDKSYAVNCVYNCGFANMMWKVYVDSEKNREGYQTYGLLKGNNTAFSGYAKMDAFYEKHEWSEAEIRNLWKIPEGRTVDEIKRVIIAPHHSIMGYGGILYSTFPKNAFFLLYLAKKYQDKVSFIYKPHPNLRLRAVEAGVFESYEAYDAYVGEWDSLPNARVVNEASYLEIFATSDAMIMDSASFIAEYLYVNKPLLFLRRNGQAFNLLGKELMRAYDTAWGEDYSAIESFLQDVVIDGRDEKKPLRQTIWKENLDYLSLNHCMASEFIYRDICNLLQRCHKKMGGGGWKK